MQEPIKITEREDLDALLADEYPPARIDVSLDPLSEQENEYWSRKLTKQYTACGCTAGSLTMLLGLVLLVGYAASQLLAGQGLDLFASTGGLVAVGVLGFVAKVLGKRLARHRFRSNAGRLQDEIAVAEGETDVGRCG
jgi:hypothetical protein